MQNRIQKMRAAIGNNQFGEVFKLLEELAQEDRSLLNHHTLLKARYHDLKTQTINGTLTLEQGNLSYNVIRQAILDLIDEWVVIREEEETEGFLPKSLTERWIQSYIVEENIRLLGKLVEDLRMDFSENGTGKCIQSGLEYWGVGPSHQWERACTDAAYKVMSDGIAHFENQVNCFKNQIHPNKYHYVSFGSGTGEKDRIILKEYISEEQFYIPIDISSEMLKIGVRHVLKTIQRKPLRYRAINLDFSETENIEELKIYFRDVLRKNHPILYSLLGNTLSNFSDPKKILRSVSRLLEKEDLMLLEIATVQECNPTNAELAAMEYAQSEQFKKFAVSSLLLYTDLQLKMDSVQFRGEMEPNQEAIQILCYYQNEGKKTIPILLAEHSKISLKPKDTIRLYLSRKYTLQGIDSLVSKCNLKVIARQKRNNRMGAFGSELLLLQKLE
jgi:L-histidine Nalpha-methyltransferase